MKDFKPTPECINALPDPLRLYIHDLETRCDPAGDVAALTLAADQLQWMQIQLNEIQNKVIKLKAGLLSIAMGRHSSTCQCDDALCTVARLAEKFVAE